jgi:radical SAM protein with 4Fe4S-binding SPASM domain
MTGYLKIAEAVITEKTRTNLLRKSDSVDKVQFLDDGTPCFSWIDISLTELCNRACAFCPRVDPSEYPNQNLHFSLETLRKIVSELESIRYGGSVVFCGYGEPLLHPRILDVVSIFGTRVNTEIVTNGDRLTPALTQQLFAAGLGFLCVSMYDGPHQVDKFEEMFKSIGLDERKYILRDRWHSHEDQFGLKLTNRGGVLDFGPKEDFSRLPCHYLSYSLTVDWNGDVLLCVQDWNKKVKFGNLAVDSLVDVWKSLKLHKKRQSLIAGDRSDAPCNVCNTDGTFHGFNHVVEWGRTQSF